MKIFFILSSIFVNNLIASPSNIFEDPKDAAKFLGNSHSRSKRRVVPQFCSNELLTIPGEFTTVKDWERVKDALDECNLPKDEIERLEACAKSCSRRDWWPSLGMYPRVPSPEFFEGCGFVWV